MLMWGIRRHNMREVLGQILRVIGVATWTWAALVPHGITGSAKISAFKSMAIPHDIAGQIANARDLGGL
jgi:hypothetical protein